MAMNLVRPPSTRSSMTESASIRPDWGRAWEWLSIFTPMARRSSRLSRTAGSPFTSEAKPAGAVVTVVLSSIVVVVVGGSVVVLVDVVVDDGVLVVAAGAVVVVVVTAASPLQAAANRAKATMRVNIRAIGRRA
jgi:hypothetical protein